MHILVDGIAAANDLGLTAAVLARIDGHRRPIKLGNLILDFHNAAPSRLCWDRPPYALCRPSIGCATCSLPTTDNFSASSRFSETRIMARRSDDLGAGLSALPEWMRAIVRDLLHQAEIDEPTKEKKVPAVRAAARRPPASASLDTPRMKSKSESERVNVFT